MSLSSTEHMRTNSHLACLFSLLSLFSVIDALAQQAKDPVWLPSLASGGAPECPNHVGTRTSRSATISMRGVNVVIVGVATRTPDHKCISTATLEVSGRLQARRPLPNPANSGYELVDFSLDGQSLLLTITHGEDWKEEEQNFSVAVLPLDTLALKPVRPYDLFGWGDCGETIEPQGFLADGQVVLLTRPSISGDRQRPFCEPDERLYRTDLRQVPARLTQDTVVKRNGEETADESMACKNDPDIVDACFTFRGRIALYNGGWMRRIWRVRTNRMLGVEDEYHGPGNLDLDWDHEVWGNFTVCPFEKEKPGQMQFVCIESADHLLSVPRK